MWKVEIRKFLLQILVANRPAVFEVCFLRCDLRSKRGEVRWRHCQIQGLHHLNSSFQHFSRYSVTAKGRVDTESVWWENVFDFVGIEHIMTCIGKVNDLD